MRQTSPKFDRRLIGTWKSDRRKTLLYYKPPADLTPEKFQQFQSLFGKLTIRWGKGKYYTDLKGFREVHPYDIVASDANSVVVRVHHEVYDRDCLQQIHFEGHHYWMALDGGSLCEWFKRVKQRQRC